MKISAVLCTYNRSASLARALTSVAGSEMPASVGWEVLVVDNHSTDETRSVVESLCEKYPDRFRYIFEPRQGKSFALNTGIREASGDVLAFLDDDVRVEPTWLWNLIAPLTDEQCAGSGGRVLPEPGFVPPSWLAVDGPFNQIGALCAYFNPGDSAGELDRPPIGANMAFRKEMFLKYGDFRTDLGPRPGSELRHEDLEFGRRLISGGERLSYVPTAIVYHEIHERRTHKEFFLAWWFALGRGSIREIEKLPGATEILKGAARITLTIPNWAFSVSSKRRFYHKCRIWYESGKLIELCQQAFRGSARVALQ
jgi:glucosyl-dolichyl phosphate glucuronosyltransferase